MNSSPTSYLDAVQLAARRKQSHTLPGAYDVGVNARPANAAATRVDTSLGWILTVCIITLFVVWATRPVRPHANAAHGVSQLAVPSEISAVSAAAADAASNHTLAHADTHGLPLAQDDPSSSSVSGVVGTVPAPSAADMELESNSSPAADESHLTPSRDADVGDTVADRHSSDDESSADHVSTAGVHQSNANVVSGGSPLSLHRSSRTAANRRAQRTATHPPSPRQRQSLQTTPNVAPHSASGSNRDRRRSAVHVSASGPASTAVHSIDEIIEEGEDDEQVSPINDGAEDDQSDSIEDDRYLGRGGSLDAEEEDEEEEDEIDRSPVPVHSSMRPRAARHSSAARRAPSRPTRSQSSSSGHPSRSQSNSSVAARPRTRTRHSTTAVTSAQRLPTSRRYQQQRRERQRLTLTQVEMDDSTHDL